MLFARGVVHWGYSNSILVSVDGYAMGGGWGWGGEGTCPPRPPLARTHMGNHCEVEQGSHTPLHTYLQGEHHI